MSQRSRSNEFGEPVADWFYLSEGAEVGPVSTDAFLQAAQTGNVLPTTRVRPPGCSDWIAAGEIDGLEFHPLQPCPGSAADAPRAQPNLEMRRLFAECVNRKRGSAPRTPREQERDSSSGPSTFQSLASSVASALRAVTSLAAMLLAPLGRLLQLRVVWLAIAVLLAELVAFQIVSKLPATFASQERDYLSLKETFTEWQELQSRGVGDTEWDEFCARSEEKLETVLPNLERSARSSDPISMTLLRIARDDMPRLLYERPPPDSRIAMDTIAHFWAPQAKFRETAHPAGQWSMGTITIIGIDVLIVLAAIGYFGWIWRRKWASAQN